MVPAAILRHVAGHPEQVLGRGRPGGGDRCAVLIPWLDRSPVKSGKYRPSFRFFFWIFVLICVGLGYLGSQEPTQGLALIARILTFGYFAFFLIVMPILSFTEKTKPIPMSIADAVLTRTKAAAAAAE